METCTSSPPIIDCGVRTVGEPRLIPIHAAAVFYIYPGEILQVTRFYYLEETGFYDRLLARKGRGLEEELERLKGGMTRVLSEERIVVNGAEAHPIVSNVDIALMGSKRPVFTFHIYVPFQAKSGRNVYENLYEETTTNYPYEAYWTVPPCGRIISIEASGETGVSQDGRIAWIKAAPGIKVEGYESIVFENNC